MDIHSLRREILAIGQAFLGMFRWNQNKLNPQTPDIMEELDQAQKDWNYAQMYFNHVTDPDLIDFAIFNMEAAEKKYIYLLKRAREKGVSTEEYSLA